MTGEFTHTQQGGRGWLDRAYRAMWTVVRVGFWVLAFWRQFTDRLERAVDRSRLGSVYVRLYMCTTVQTGRAKMPSSVDTKKVASCV